MNIEALSATAATPPPRPSDPAQQVDRKRQEGEQAQTTQKENKVQPEELLGQINSLTEDGTYSVRFEKDSGSNQMIVKIVDSSTDEVIRQIPPESLLNLSKQLDQLSGNIVNTLS